jgi:hypothetical protein
MGKEIPEDLDKTLGSAIQSLEKLKRFSILELRDPNHPFFEWIRQELPHLLSDDRDCFESWFTGYVDWEDSEEQDMLSDLHDWIPYCLAQKLYEYGFDLQKYGYFSGTI